MRLYSLAIEIPPMIEMFLFYLRRVLFLLYFFTGLVQNAAVIF